MARPTPSSRTRSATDRRTHDRRTSGTQAPKTNAEIRTPHRYALRAQLAPPHAEAKQIVSRQLAYFTFTECLGALLLVLGHTDTTHAIAWICLGVIPLIHTILLTAFGLADLMSNRHQSASGRFVSAGIIAVGGIILALMAFATSLALTLTHPLTPLHILTT